MKRSSLECFRGTFLITQRLAMWATGHYAQLETINDTGMWLLIGCTAEYVYIHSYEKWPFLVHAAINSIVSAMYIYTCMCSNYHLQLHADECRKAVKPNWSAEPCYVLHFLTLHFEILDFCFAILLASLWSFAYYRTKQIYMYTYNRLHFTIITRDGASTSLIVLKSALSTFFKCLTDALSIWCVP